MSELRSRNWEPEEEFLLKREWIKMTTTNPHVRAAILAPAFNRSQWSIFRKAEKMGLYVRETRKATRHTKIQGNDAYHFCLRSPEEQWKQAWMRAHGTRGYDGRAISA